MTGNWRKTAGLIGILAGSIAIPLALAAQDAEAIYRARVAAFVRDPGHPVYTPMENIAGARPYYPLPLAARPAISAEALGKARDYAAANRSTALLVWHKGRLVTQWYATGTTSATPLISKSLSKPLAAIAVGRAIALGKLHSLDQPLAELFPELKGQPRGAILVRHLLDMRSGLLDQGFNADPEHPWNRALLDTDHGNWILQHYPLIDAPGSRYAYTNAPADLIAMVIEKATGRRYGEFIGHEVLAKIGAAGGDIWVNRPGGLAHSGCCMDLPAESWLRLGVLLAQDGVWGGKRLLSSAYVAEMRKGTPQNPSFGLGVWIGEPYREKHGFGAAGAPGPVIYQSEPYLDPGLFLFDGNNSQTVHISPREQLVVLRMGDNPPATPGWDNAYLPNLLIRGLNK